MNADQFIKEFREKLDARRAGVTGDWDFAGYAFNHSEQLLAMFTEALEFVRDVAEDGAIDNYYQSQAQSYLARINALAQGEKK